MQLATKRIGGAKKKRVFTETKLDESTGELIPKRWIDMQPISGENFIQLHINTLAKLTGITDAQWRLLSNLTMFVEYNTNELFLNPKRKEELSVITGLKYNTINQSVSRLVRKKLLIKISANTYQMNPTLFFKGSEVERAKYMEFIVRYEICPTC